MLRRSAEAGEDRGVLDQAMMEYIVRQTYEDETKIAENNVHRTAEVSAGKSGQDVIGRVHMPSALAGEVVYLRMLLHTDVSRGAQSFEDLKLGRETFKEACRHLGLLQVTLISSKIS